MIAQRPPALIKGNARAAQKSLHGNVEHERIGENYEAQGGKIRKAERLDQFAIAITGKWRDLRYGTGSGSEWGAYGSGHYRGARSLPLPVPYRSRPAHLQTAIGSANRGATSIHYE